MQLQQRSLLLRVHFWAALIASPIALIAAITGILYIFTPQIEQALYSHLDSVTPSGVPQPLDTLVQSALKDVPDGWVLHAVSPAQNPTDSARVIFMRDVAKKIVPSEHAGHGQPGVSANKGASQPPAFLRTNFGLPNQALVVYVNPYSAQVLGRLPQSERFSIWAKSLHSRYLQNDRWRWIVELAASWLMVMLVTGIYLWWPRGQQSGLPQSAAKGRLAWKQWHAFVGVAVSLMSAVILVTGLTWSKNAGEQIRWLRDATGQRPPRISAQFTSTVPENGKMLNWEQAYQAIRHAAPEVSMQITPPAGLAGFWRVSQLDRGQPERLFDLLIDAYSGRTLYYSDWDQQTMFGKATAIGIPFHRGEFGWWNQALLFAFGASIIFSIVSGWVMYFKRQRQGAARLPRLVPDAWKALSVGMGVGALAMCIAMPLLAVSAVPVLMIEAALAWRVTGRIR